MRFSRRGRIEDKSVTPDSLPISSRIFAARSAASLIPPSTGTSQPFPTKVARRSPAHAGQRLEDRTQWVCRAPRPRGAGNGWPRMLQFSVPRSRGTQLLKTLARPGAARLCRAAPGYFRGDPNSVLKTHRFVQIGNSQSPSIGSCSASSSKSYGVAGGVMVTLTVPGISDASTRQRFSTAM